MEKTPAQTHAAIRDAGAWRMPANFPFGLPDPDATLVVLLRRVDGAAPVHLGSYG
ncbi:MAG: hypothetical protein ACRDZ4_18245 [Egibacteraceae bacterium]